MWANSQRVAFDAELQAGRDPQGPEGIVEAATIAMYLWYALLWSVIEGFNKRAIKFEGRLKEDVDSISAGLRRCRNAVFHIPRAKYWDRRLFDFMNDADSAPRLRRISSGFGRLFIEEFEARRIG